MKDMRMTGRIGPTGCGGVLAEEDRMDRMGGIGAVEQEVFYDNLSGEWLDPDMVREARKAEMEEVGKHAVYDKIPLEEC